MVVISVVGNICTGFVFLEVCLFGALSASNL